MEQLDQPILSVQNLSKSFGQDVVALNNISLDIRDGEFVTLLGPSGSGKTTLLMLIAGFERATAGEISSRNRVLTDVRPEQRNFGVVFQSYALFPHMSVLHNIMYPLRVRKVHRAESRRRATEAMDLVGLKGYEDRRPGQLSGGQQQRVALARALVYEPSVLLLDEPLGALDRALRERMQIELRRLHRRLGVTFIYVTHDQDEALSMSDRVVILREGNIEQVGSPQEIYEYPSTRFVADFIGKANILDGRVKEHSNGFVTVQVGDSTPVRLPTSVDLSGNVQVGIVIRPSKIAIASESDMGSLATFSLTGKLSDEEYVGDGWQYTAVTQAGAVRFFSPERQYESSSVVLQWRPEDSWIVA